MFHRKDQFRSIRIYPISIICCVKIKYFRFFFGSFFSKYFLSSRLLWFPMIVSKKSHQNLSDYIQQFLFKKRFKVDKKQIFLDENWEIQVIAFMNMLTRFSDRIFNPMCYTGYILKLQTIVLNFWYSSVQGANKKFLEKLTKPAAYDTNNIHDKILHITC